MLQQEGLLEEACCKKQFWLENTLRTNPCQLVIYICVFISELYCVQTQEAGLGWRWQHSCAWHTATE